MEAAVTYAEERGIAHVATAAVSGSRDANRFFARLALGPHAVLRRRGGAEPVRPSSRRRPELAARARCAAVARAHPRRACRLVRSLEQRAGDAGGAHPRGLVMTTS